MLEAMKTAAKKHAPWNYTAAILERCLHSGIRTLEEFKTTPAKSGYSFETTSGIDYDLFEKMLNSED